jgi:hypothetical protein
MAELPGASADADALGRAAGRLETPLEMLLISEAICSRSFLQKHAEHAEYHRTPVQKATREVQWMVNRQGKAKLEGLFQVFLKKISSDEETRETYLLV